MATGLNLLLGIPILPGVFLLVFDNMVFQVVLPLLVNIQLPFEFVLLRNYMGGGALCNIVEALSTSTGCHSVVPNHL